MAMPKGRPFEKGVSGNPNGRPKGTSTTQEIRELARQHCPDAIATLASADERPRRATYSPHISCLNPARERDLAKLSCRLPNGQKATPFLLFLRP